MAKSEETGYRGKDYCGREIVWYKKSYDFHCIKHPEIRKNINKINQALKTPDLREINKKRKSTDYYVQVRLGRDGNPLYMKLVVDYNEEPAFIRTAHLTSDTGMATIYN